MKRTAAALRSLSLRVASGVGLEGTFLLAGTALLAAGSAYLSPAGPLFVVGGMSILAGLALAIPAKRS